MTGYNIISDQQHYNRCKTMDMQKYLDITESMTNPITKDEIIK